MVMPSKKSPKRKSRDGPKLDKASKKPFKKKTKADEIIKSDSLALQLEDEVPDFPRGGGSSLSRQEREDIRAEAELEFEADGRRSNKSKRKKTLSRSRENEDDEVGSLFGGGITGKLPKYANKITSKNISPGMKLCGLVAEVNEKDLVISLPGGLRGLVHIADSIDPNVRNNLEVGDGAFLPTIFRIGQLVSCVVLRLDDDKKEGAKRKIWLSLRLSVLYKSYTLDNIVEGMVLTAYVKSVEDHGYILDFGLPSFEGFLRRDSNAEVTEHKVNIGKLVQGVVWSIDKNRKVVYMSSDPDTLSKYVTKDFKGMSIDLLVPGMMVNGHVKALLQNGILLSFLSYFTGTVDLFHLQNMFPTGNWKDDYKESKKVHARILFIDPSSRAVGLTMNPHLIHCKAPPSHVKIGDIYDGSKVVRVDKGSGILLEVPSSSASTPAYISISDVAEDDSKKLEKKYRQASNVRVRILGFRQLEGVATGTLKASAFEGPVFTHSDVKPGMVVRAKVISVDNFGAIVQIPGGIKALCPIRHMSEVEISKPGKKFKVGAELVYRVLGCKSKRITVTHKKTLVKSKLGIIASFADASEGFITHGWITRIEQQGCFVRFYNGVQGFAPRSELGIEPGGDPSSLYTVGQVVKCRVTSSNPTSRRINLSFLMKPKRVSEDNLAKLGSIISGVVDSLTSNAVTIFVDVTGFSKGTISYEHLADHYGHADLLKSVLKPGYQFQQLLVLDIKGNDLILSAKSSLINSAQQLPSDFSHVSPGQMLHGYVCNLIETGCFVRFLGRLTGFSPRKKAIDGQKTDLLEAFYIGQSVRAAVLDVNKESGRLTLSLKQSLCSSTDESFIREYFTNEEKIAGLQSTDTGTFDLQWVEGFSIGSLVEGKIEEVKDVGAVVSFENYNDVLGFITSYQCGTMVEIGSVVQAVVLDVSKTERLVDLSLKTEFISMSKKQKSFDNKKKRKQALKDLAVNKAVNAVVEVVKENYLVISVPEFDYSLGYLMIYDYNTQRLPRRQFLNGQSVVATVIALPDPQTSGRMLLLLDELKTSRSKRAKKSLGYSVGSLVDAEITEIKPLELKLRFGNNLRGRIHITEVNDANAENPFAKFKIGQTVNARIVAKDIRSNIHKNFQWELSIKPHYLTDSSDLPDACLSETFEYCAGQSVTGYVYKVDSEWAWLTISRNVRARLYILDSSCEPSELESFQKRYHMGKPVSGYILSINSEKKLLRLLLRPVSPSSSVDGQNGIISGQNNTAYVQEGDTVGGRISKILPGVGGLLVQIGPHMSGRVHFTELSDEWVPDPLNGYQEGHYVKCRVLEVVKTVQGTIHVDLSLRSLDVTRSQNPETLVSPTSNKDMVRIEELHPDMIVQGYVKNVSPKGCFILLSRKIDAKIRLSNLADKFVDDPDKEYPVGKLVTGRVLSVDPLSNRIEVTLKAKAADGRKQSEKNDFGSLQVGDIISGSIRRLESFGLFISVDNTNLVGLCHVSELSDEQIDNIETIYRAGEKIKARVLKVDEERNRISLGMKASYMGSEFNIERPPKQDVVGVDEINSFLGTKVIGGIPGTTDRGVEIDKHQALANVEARASVPPLEVNLDDLEGSELDETSNEKQNHANEVQAVDVKEKRRAKKKAKEEREREIRLAEERLLEKDIPRTADEFEKLVRTSPNSSFVWIKYMAFMLSMADIEKARSLAERALRTINIREENEKLNVWKAYFNLENQYGNPPQEAVMKLFQRALQYNDPKRVYLALLEMYERTEQHALADELLDKMTKKFKHSCKVWLRRVQRLLKQKQDGMQSIVSQVSSTLPRHKLIKFLTQTAILEFKNGVPDRGRSLFEGVLREYPKRTDLWSIYVDQEIRLGDADIIRALFERAISLSLPPKKMKFLFKKYLEYEKSHGDDERIVAVKRKAMEYVQSTMA